MEENKGILVLLAGPIGNREDITLRALRILKEADLIACEDSRHTGPLMDYYGVRAGLISYQKFNEKKRTGEILQAVRSGKKVVLMTDAGMPGISDPGMIVLKEAIKEGLPFTVLPGPSAGVTCYVASGLGDGTYYFIGFLPRKGKERDTWLKKLDALQTSAVIYEAPHRIRKTVEEFGQRWPDRRIVLCREWTKTFEERISFLGKEAGNIDLTERGEFVIILDRAEEGGTLSKEDQIESAEVILKDLIDRGHSTKEAINMAKTKTNLSRNELYNMALNITKKK